MLSTARGELEGSQVLGRGDPHDNTQTSYHDLGSSWWERVSVPSVHVLWSSSRPCGKSVLSGGRKRMKGCTSNSPTGREGEAPSSAR